MFDLLFGRDVTLVNWDIPDLEAGFDFRQTFAIYPPLYLTLFGGVTFETNFDLGYDTRGIRQFVGAGSDPAKAGLLLNGLFLKDELGNELELTAVIGAGLELNVAVAKAGVEGGLTGIIGADLDDPNNDGKVHLDELAYNFSRGPECIFDFNGSLSVFLAAYIQVGMSTPFGFVELYNQRFELFDATLFDWNLETCPPVDPKLAEFIVSFDHDGNGATANVATLVLNMGPRAVLVIPGDSSDGDEVFTVDLQRNEDGTLHALGGLTVTGNGYSQSFNAADLTGVSWISFEGGVGNDSVVITPDVTLSVWGRGGDGNDNLFGGSGINVLFGDADSDMLVGRLADDILSGGDGNDFIYGYGGADLLDGGNGADAIFGDDDLGNMVTFNADNPLFNGGLDGADTISGGEGNDRIVAGAGNDVVHGGAGDDVIDAGAGNDHVQGDAGNDQILGGAGDDDLWGDDLAGSVTQGSATLNADKIQGGSGYNRIWGGPGNDLLYAGDEVQLALAPAVAGPPSGWSTLLYGGDGADMLYGTAGADRLEGGFGSDYISSGAGADLLLGGPGNDGLIAAGGNATLLGGHGDDLMDGGAGQNWIEGGPGHDDIFAREGADTVYGGSTALGYGYLLADLAGPAAVVDPLHGGFQSTVSADGCEPVIYYYPEVYAPTFGPLTGEIFFDMNRDGLRGGNEPLIPAGQQWHVVLTDVTRIVTLMDATVSNSALSLAQGGVPAGDYWVVLSPLAGNTWLPTNATSSVQALVSVDSSGAWSVPQFGYYKTDDKGTAGLSVAPETPTGVATTGLKAMALGAMPRGDTSVSGMVWWHDVNDPAPGRSLSEPGIAGQTIELRDPAGTVVATAVTDVSGNYAFNGLLAGTYTVRQAPELPWRQVVAEGTVAEHTWLSAQASDMNRAVSTLAFLDFSTAQATWVAELPLQVRDLALMGQNDVYLSGAVLGAMGSTNGLWHYDLQTRDLQQLSDPRLGQAPEMLALDVLDATHLLGMSASADVYNFDIGSEVWSRVGTLRDNAGQALQTIGDVALVSPGQAFAVVALASAMGGEVQPDNQLLVSFDPVLAEITRDTAPLRIQNAPTLFIGLEWDGTSLKALGRDGQTYTIDPVRGTVQHDAVLAGMAPGPRGGLAWSASDQRLIDKDGTFTVTLGDGQTATIGFGDKPDGIVLPDGNDRIDGGCGPEADLLYGDDGLNLPANVITLGGYDTIRGRDGDDTIDGGKKGDVLSGDDGNDLIIGGREASNIVNGGAGQDTLTGGPAADVILGGAGNDTLNGLAGDDWLYGEAGNDSLVGGLDNDLLVGGAGTDTSSGGAGDDQLVVINTDLGGLYGDNPAGIEGDLYDGGAGVDSIVVVDDTSLVLTTGSLTLSGAPTDVIVSIEQSWLKGGASPNLLDASAFDGKSWIFGEGANDTLLGGSGADWIDGGGNDDALTGGQGNDTLLGGAGSNTMAAGSGDDLYVIDAASSTNLLTEAAGAGSDTVDLTGVATSLNVDLGQGGGRHLNVDSTLPAGPDVDGSAGEFETILLGSGHDSVRVATAIGAGLTVDAGAGIDTLDYSGASNGNAWSVPVIVDLGAGLASGLDAANAFENVIGGSGNDSLTGSAGPNLLNGGPGNDVLSGQDGADTLIGGNGNDALYGGDGNDVMQGQSGQNTLEGGSGNDVYLLPDLHFSDQVAERALSSDGFDTLDFSGQSQDMVLTLTNSTISAALADDSLLAAQEAQGVEVILGGSGRDWFLMTVGTSLPYVLLDGGRTASDEFTDANVLDYRSFNTSVSVDLQDATNLTASSIGSATGTHGVVNLRHIFGGSGDDTLLGGNLTVWLEGGDGNDLLVGSIQDDLLYGGAGDDTVKGGDGNDEIVGGDGAGNDSYDGGRGVDTVRYSSATTPITVNLAQGFASGHEIGEDSLLDIENIIGGQGADTLSGDDNANRIDGGDGNDTTSGGAGDDVLIGGAGDDTAVFIGLRQAYSIAWSAATSTFTVSSLAEGTDTLSGIESLNFSDGSFRALVNINDLPTGTVTISGASTQGQTLTAANTLADLDGLGTISYQWKAGGADIVGATSSTFVLTQAQVGKTITVAASYTDGHGTVEAVTSIATTAVVTPPASHHLQGRVQDGYVAGAAIYIDSNANNLPDAEEATGLFTDAQGNFTGEVLNAGTLIAVGGTNIDTGLTNQMILKAPEGSGIISPITTLVEALIDTQGLSAAAAQQALISAFGLTNTLDLLQYDPLAQGNTDPTALSVQKLSVQLALTATLAADTQGVMNGVAQLVASIATPLNLTDASTLSLVLASSSVSAGTQASITQANQAVAGSNTLTEIATAQLQALDTIPPTIVISTNHLNLTVGETATIGFTLSEPSTNFVVDDVTVSGGALSNFTGSAPSYSATFTPEGSSTANGVVSVASGKFTDAANNANADGTDANNTVTMTVNTVSLDTTAPIVGSFNPLDEANGAPIAGNITITFNEAITAGTGNVTLKNANDTIVATYEAASSANLEITGNTLSINPTANLAYSTDYKVEIGVGTIKDLAGNNYAGTTSYNFSTTSALNESEVQKLYIAYFNRPGDVAGLAYWESLLADGVSMSMLQNSFSSSPEYQAIYVGQSKEALIARLYQNLFGREVSLDDPGVVWWAKQMTDGFHTITTIAGALAAGTTPGTPDNIAIIHKIAAATSFTNALDTAAEVDNYIGAAAFGIAGNWLAPIIDTNTLNTALGNRDATIATAVAAKTVQLAGPGSWDAAPTDVTFVLAAASFDYTISGFGTGDRIDFPTGSAPTLDNTSTSDGQVGLHWTSGANHMAITLVGLSGVQDAQLNSVADFNSVFGAGSVY